MTELREKLLNLKIDSTQVLRENVDALYLTEHDADQIIKAVEQNYVSKEEIEKLIDEKQGFHHEGYHGYAGETPNIISCKTCISLARLKNLLGGDSPSPSEW